MRRVRISMLIILMLFMTKGWSVNALAAEEAAEDAAILSEEEPAEEMLAEEGTEASLLSEDLAAKEENSAREVKITQGVGEDEPAASGTAGDSSGEEKGEELFPLVDESEIPEDQPEPIEKTADRLHFIALNNTLDSSEAILVESNGLYGLIDASHPSGVVVEDKYPEYTFEEANGQTVVKYLSDLAGVEHLTFVLGTHAHSDHLGGIPDVAASGLVNNDTVYIYKKYEAEEEYIWHTDYYAETALQTMQAQGAVMLDLSEPSEEGMNKLGAVFTEDPEDSVGDHISFQFGDFVIRLYNLYNVSKSNENLNSVVSTVQKGDARAVLMSDMEMEDGMEDRVVKAIVRGDGTARTDVYKVGHHGHARSNGVATIAALNPEYAVVCTSRTKTEPEIFSYYNYLLEKTGGETYRTCDNEAGLIADFGENEVSILAMKEDGTVAAPLLWVTSFQSGWNRVIADATLQVYSIYITASGDAAKGWFQDENKDWYFADSRSYMQTGWLKSNNKWYYLSYDGRMRTGWQWITENWYYLNNSGAMQTGWQMVGGKWYLMNGSGVMLTDWQNPGGLWYYLGDNGAMRIGWQLIRDSWYYLSKSGVMQTGWQLLSGKWYLLSGSGVMQTGWKDLGGQQYYLADNGAMQTGWLKQEEKHYYFNDKGVLEERKGWQQILADWFFLDPDRTARTGWQFLSSKWYLFADTGAMQTGWVKENGKHYFLNSSGAYEEKEGWQKIQGKWYILASSGEALTGWQKDAGKWYFMDDAGEMQTGWLQDAGKWYYLDGSGMMRTGFLKWGASTYYMNGNGVMQTGWVKIGDMMYFFDENGVMQSSTGSAEQGDPLPQNGGEL